MIDKLRNLFATKYKFGAEELEEFMNSLYKVTYKKGEMIVSNGKELDALLLIESGLIRSYMYNEDGNEITFGFFMEYYWVTQQTILSKGSIIKNTIQDKTNMEVMEDVTAYAISIEDYRHLISKYIRVDKYNQGIYMNLAIQLRDSYIDLITYSAEKRYERFLAQYPNLESRISQKQIATFLMMTPEHLSRIKSRRYHELKNKVYEGLN